jgi:Tfp pilus assembly protein PilN
MKPPYNNNWLIISIQSVWKKIVKALGVVVFLSPADDRISFKKTLCLAVEKGEISVAVGSRFFSRINGIKAKKYLLAANEYPSPEFLASCLSLARAELRAGNCRLTLSLPKAWAIIKTVDYPCSVLENISNVITFELDRITPFTPENAYFDFRVFKEGAEKVNLLVAAARMDQVDPYLKAIQEKGFKVDQISVNLLGLGTLCRYRYKTDQILFVGIDEKQYEGLIYLSNNSLKIFFGVFPGGDEKTLVARILQEIESSHFIPGELGSLEKTVIYLKEINPSLKDEIRSRMKGPVEFLDEADMGVESREGKQGQLPYVAVGGVLESLWIKSLGINLLLKGLRKKSKPSLAITILLVLVLAVLFVMYWMTPIGVEKERLQNIEKQIASKKVEIKKVDNLKQEIETVYNEIRMINDFKQSKPLSSNILKELTLVLPKNSWLTRVRVFESQVNIEGYSPSATLLISKLEASELFKKVEFSSPTFRDPRQNMDRFQIKMELEGPAAEKGKGH